MLAGGCMLAALLLAGGCTEQHGISPGTVAQTKFPGQLAAGGLGSGEVMQRTRQSSTSSMPSGTPGIPEGSGGTTSGVGMGGTTPKAAVAQEGAKGKMQGEAPIAGSDPARAGAVNAGQTKPPGEGPGAAPAADAAAQGKAQAEAPKAGEPARAGAAETAPAADAAAQTEAARKAAAAQKEKEELVASMDDITRRWRAGAAKNNWPTHPPTPVAAVAGLTASGTQEQGRIATPPPVRSEKQGDAAPSEDVKKPKEPGAK
jgi:hypothetical protein